MHDWAAVNSWSRPVTNPGNGRFSVNIPVPTTVGNGRYSVNIPVSTAATTPVALRRCQTNLFGPTTVFDKRQVYKPKEKYGPSCTLNYIRYLKVSNKESEAKLKDTMHVLSVQRSKSDLDVRGSHTEMNNLSMLGDGMLKERSVFMPTTTDYMRKEGSAGSPKQEIRVGVAVIPRKGLIALSTSDNSDHLPVLSSHGERRRNTDHGAGRQKTQSLIKRKDIMDHFKAGFKLLEDEELQKHEEDELHKILGEYTILDLQSKILEMTGSYKMTDAKTINRSAHSEVPSSTTKQTQPPLRREKTTLPTIKTVNPFITKS